MLYFIDDATAELPAAQHKNAIVSIVIGENFQSVWERLCRKSWEEYAAKLELDIIILRTALDDSPLAQGRSPAWQKLLILQQPWAQRYARVIWLDADIIIAPWAHGILEYCPEPEKVGISISQACLSPVEQQLYYERIYNVNLRADYGDEFIRLEHQKIFDQYDIHDYQHMYNTGVMVLSPQHHNELFLEAYATEDKGRLYEQPKLSQLIDARGMAHHISPRFNWGVFESIALYVPNYFGEQLSGLNEIDLKFLEVLIHKEYRNSYFLHFYGAFGLMSSIPYNL